MKNIKNAILQADIDLIDAKYLMSFVLNIELTDLPLQFYNKLSPDNYNQFNNLVKQRKLGKPVDIIIGKKHFWKGEFIIDKNVLSPRCDSETIIETVLSHFKNRDKHYKILDLGTGSGCLIISLLNEYKNATGLGLDISKQALTVAKQNAVLNKTDERIEFVWSDWFKNLPQQKYDIILSNPPYISSTDISCLSVEVRDYDPHLALDGGTDGLNPYRIISKQVHQYMEHNSLLFVELGINQSDKVQKIFNNNDFSMIKKSKDLDGIIRIHTYIKKN